MKSNANNTIDNIAKKKEYEIFLNEKNKIKKGIENRNDLINKLLKDYESFFNDLYESTKSKNLIREKEDIICILKNDINHNMINMENINKEIKDINKKIDNYSESEKKYESI